MRLHNSSNYALLDEYLATHFTDALWNKISKCEERDIILIIYGISQIRGSYDSVPELTSWLLLNNIPFREVYLQSTIQKRDCRRCKEYKKLQFDAAGLVSSLKL